MSPPKLPEGEIAPETEGERSDVSSDFVGDQREKIVDKLHDTLDGDHTESEPKLTEEQRQTIATLKDNFNKNEAKLKTRANWDEVEATLKQNSVELSVLKKLIDRGGEPTLLIGLEGAYLFVELSQEAPQANKKRDKNLNAIRANELATEMGAELMSREEYIELRKLGVQLDINSHSWLKSNPNLIQAGRALVGHAGYVTLQSTHDYNGSYGFRCTVLVI